MNFRFQIDDFIVEWYTFYDYLNEFSILNPQKFRRNTVETFLSICCYNLPNELHKDKKAPSKLKI